MNVNSPPPIPRLNTSASSGFPVLTIPGSSLSTNAALHTTPHHGLPSSSSFVGAATGRNSPSQQNDSIHDASASSLARRPPATLGDATAASAGTAAGKINISDLRQYPLHSGSLHDAMNSMLRALIAISEEHRALKEAVSFTESSAKALNQKVIGEINEINREFVQNLVRKKDWSDARFEDHRKVETVARSVADVAAMLHAESGTVFPRIGALEEGHEQFKKAAETELAKMVRVAYFDEEMKAMRGCVSAVQHSVNELLKDMRLTSQSELQELQQTARDSIVSQSATLLQRIEQLTVSHQSFELRVGQALDEIKKRVNEVSDRVAVLEVDVRADRQKTASALLDTGNNLQRHEETSDRWRKSHEERFTSFHNAAFLRLARLESGAEDSVRAVTATTREMATVQSALSEISGDMLSLQSAVANNEGSVKKSVEDVARRVTESEAYCRQRIDAQAEDWRTVRGELDARLKRCIDEATEASAAVWKQQQRNESAWQESIKTSIEHKIRGDFAKSLTELDETAAKIRSQLLRVDETQHVVISDLQQLNRDFSSQRTQMDNLTESISTLEEARGKEFQRAAQSDKQCRQAIQDLFDLVNATNVEVEAGKKQQRWLLANSPVTTKSGATATTAAGTSSFVAADVVAASDEQDEADARYLEPVTLHMGADGMMSLTPRRIMSNAALVQSRNTSPVRDAAPLKRRTGSGGGIPHPHHHHRLPEHQTVRGSGVDLTRDFGNDPAERMQVFAHPSNLKSPPPPPPPLQFASSTSFSSSSGALHNPSVVLIEPLPPLPSTFTHLNAAAAIQQQQPRQGSNEVSGRSGSAPLTIPQGLPRLGLEVANRRLQDGVVVLGVTSHLPAYAAGLCRGDIIVAVAGHSVRSKTEFVEALQKATSLRPPGERQVTLEVQYVACSNDGEFDNTSMDKVPDARKRKVSISASTTSL